MLKQFEKTAFINRICAVLMLALLVLQFMPFWQYGDPATQVSIQGYIWFPFDHTGLDAVFQEAIDAGYTINQLLVMPILVLALGAAGIFFCLFKSAKPLASLFPLSCGLVGAIGYLSHAAFRMGSNRPIHLTVCIALVVLSAVPLLAGFTSARR